MNYFAMSDEQVVLTFMQQYNQKALDPFLCTLLKTSLLHLKPYVLTLCEVEDQLKEQSIN